MILANTNNRTKGKKKKGFGDLQIKHLSVKIFCLDNDRQTKKAARLVRAHPRSELKASLKLKIPLSGAKTDH